MIGGSSGISKLRCRWNSPLPKPLGQLLCIYWFDSRRKCVCGLVNSLDFGSKPQQISYSQTRMFRGPDWRKVQDTWNNPHSVEFLDCQWLSGTAEMLAFVSCKQHCSLAQSLIAGQWDCQQEWMHFHLGHRGPLVLIQTGIWATTYAVKDTIHKVIWGLDFHLVNLCFSKRNKILCAFQHYLLWPLFIMY